MTPAERAAAAWVEATTDRWDVAMTSTPPDFAALADLPRLPGDVSLAAFAEAVRDLTSARAARAWRAEMIADLIDRERRLLDETRATVARLDAQLAAIDDEAERDAPGGIWARGKEDRRRDRIARRAATEANLRDWRPRLEREALERNAAIRALLDVAGRCT